MLLKPKLFDTSGKLIGALKIIKKAIVPMINVVTAQTIKTRGHDSFKIPFRTIMSAP